MTKFLNQFRIYWFVIAYNERLLHTWIRHTENVWFYFVKACTASYEWLQTLITTWHERETEMQVISNPSISITFQFVCFKIIKQQALSFISKSFFLLNKYMYQSSSDFQRKNILFCLFLSHFKWSTSIQSLNSFWLQKTYGTLFPTTSYLPYH